MDRFSRGTIKIAGGITVIILLLLAIKQYSSFPGKIATGPSQSTHTDQLLCENWLNTVINSRLELQLALETNSYPGISSEIQKPRLLAAKLYSRGANIVPVIVDRLRKEKDDKRSQLLELLLGRFARIHLGFRPNPIDGGPLKWDDYESLRSVVISEFLKEWDSGVYVNPEAEIFKRLPLLPKVSNGERIMAPDVRPVSNYGIFGLPFLFNQLRTNNNPVIFAIILSKIDHPVAYRYWGTYLDEFPTHDEKITVVLGWWSENHQKFNELHPLYEKIDAAVKALPKFEEETNSVATGASP